MLRVPGSTTDLLSVKADGGDVRIVYSPLDAVKLAEQNPAKEVVFFAVGFETTAPATAMAVYQAAQKGPEELLDARLARAGAAGDGGDAVVAATAACRPFWPPATSARSWATRNTTRSPRSIACRSW